MPVTLKPIETMTLVDRYALCTYLMDVNDQDVFVFRPKLEIVDRVRARQAMEEQEQGTGEEIILPERRAPSTQSAPPTPAPLLAAFSCPTPAPSPATSSSTPAPPPATSSSTPAPPPAVPPTPAPPPVTSSSTLAPPPATTSSTPAPPQATSSPPTPAPPPTTSSPPNPTPPVAGGSPMPPATTAAGSDCADSPEVAAPSDAVGDSVKPATRKRVRQERESEQQDVRPSTRARKAESGVGTRVTRATTKTQSTRGGGAVKGKGGAMKAKRR